MKLLSDFEQFSSVTSTSKALASKFFIAQFINTTRKTFLSVSSEFGHNTVVVNCTGCAVVPGKVAKNRGERS